MIAKFKVTKVTKHAPNCEELQFMAVTDKPFDAGGTSEDNSFATWTPSGELKMTVQNPNLIGQIKEGEKYYLNFTKADN